MAISLASLRRGNEVKPPRLLLYGTHGIGKTSLAAGAPKPIVLQTEDGLCLIDAPTFGMLRTYGDVMEAIAELLAEPHDFQTVVLDTLDWMQPLIWAEACRLNKWQDIEQPGFGKGYLAADDTWRCLLEGITALRDERGMTAILLAHCEVKRFDPPESEPYDRYQPKLQSRASALVQEYVDAVLLANYRVTLVKDDPRDKDSRVRGVGGGARVIYTTERPSHLAKNRYRMPDQIPLPDDPAAMWNSLAEHLPYFSNTQQEAA